MAGGHYSLYIINYLLRDLTSPLVIQLATHKTKAPQKAGQKPSMSKPLINEAINQISKALITKVNKPKVKILIGKVNNTTIGRMMALTMPKTRATNNAVKKPETSKPGIRYATTNKAAALRTKRMIKYIVF